MRLSHPLASQWVNRFLDRFGGEPGTVVLESQMLRTGLGRLTLLGANPREVVQAREGYVVADGERGRLTLPLTVENLQRLLEGDATAQMGARVDRPVPRPIAAGMPGPDAWFGFLGYEAGHRLAEMPEPHEAGREAPSSDIPDVHLVRPEVLIAVDALTGASWPCNAASQEEWQRLRSVVEGAGAQMQAGRIEEPSGEPELAAMALPAPADYVAAVERTREYIRAGDIFQANITWPFAVETRRNPAEVYRAMRLLTPATHAAFLRLMGGGVVMSASPEVYLRGVGRHFETRPIKGTVRLSGGAGAMRAALEALRASEKDRAEHVMIVDVKRNDLGRLAQVGCVQVSRLMRPLALRNLVHLESTIEAELRPGVGAVEALSALFPGGSISGAPKIRACEVIRELEPCRRRVYTGCIGWIGRQSAHLNIAIRTIYSQMPQMGLYHYHAGGGITADSNAEAEWRECLLKAERLRLALGGEVKAE